MLPPYSICHGSATFFRNFSKNCMLFSFVIAETTGTESVYTIYEGHEVMFHVSTLLPLSTDNKQQVLNICVHCSRDISERIPSSFVCFSAPSRAHLIWISPFVQANGKQVFEILLLSQWWKSGFGVTLKLPKILPKALRLSFTTRTRCRFYCIGRFLCQSADVYLVSCS
ncbi:unnamed protein product [Schistocephalus solidus]|uniref:Rap-GAP domain-containing protein n=1 Tax=Schistocephalus solidus TaxID=70667 RepID=A0A183SJQ3_SCHSO|nr:unnamed protein product [Schistocephalus solidus]